MKFRVIIATVLVAFGLSGAVVTSTQAAPASATSTSYLWNNNGHNVWVNPYAPNYNGSVRLEKNGTGVVMRCYTDGVWFTGNYRSNRWFWLEIFSYSGLRYYGWVHSSWVQNQKAVAHC